MPVNVGQVFDSRYVINEFVSKGGTASIYNAFDKDLKCLVAVKIFDQTKIDEAIINEIWNRESEALERLSSNRVIVKFISAGRDNTSGYRYIVFRVVGWKNT